MRRFKAVVTAAAMGCVVGVSGCTGSEEPAPIPTDTSASPTPTASPTDSPSPSGTDVPPEARENTPEGAEAFIRYYIDTVNSAYVEPRTGVLSRLSDSGCQFCEKTEADIAELVAAKHRFEKRPLVLGRATSEPAPTGQAIFVATIEQRAVAVVDSSGDLVRNVDSSELKIRVAAAWEEGAWIFFELESES